MCTVETEAGLQVSQLTQGTCFGQLDALTGICHSAQVYSLTYCTFYALPVSELLSVLQVRMRLSCYVTELLSFTELLSVMSIYYVAKLLSVLSGTLAPELLCD